MDLTNYDVNTESRSSVEPGRHTLNWVGEDEDLIEGKNNWRGCKMYFEVDGHGMKISHTFTVAHDNPEVVDRGIKSLLLLAQAMGLKEPPKDTSVAFMNKSVEAEIIKGKDGYLEINDDFGKTWKAVSNTKDDTDDIQVSPSQKDLDAVNSSASDDDNIPF
tara:strand:+ start:23 stop:505 length:483 start_codon:yes stop_codon:yes gene_type:complete